MTAEAAIIDLFTGKSLTSPTAPTAVAPVTSAADAIVEAQERVDRALCVIKSASAADDLRAVLAILDGMADAVARIADEETAETW